MKPAIGFSMKKLNYCKFLGFLLLFCGFFYGNGFSQSITISIPNELVDAGDVITIPVSVNEIIADDAVLSGEWRFTTSSDLITFQSVSTEGTILDGINSTFNSTSGNFVFASTGPVTGSGTILNLTVQVRENAVKFDEAVINITDARFNEGEPQLNSESGVVSVRGIELTPKKPSGALIEGQSFQFSVEGNITEPVTWSSSDTGIATVTTDGLVEGITPGTVKIFAEDAAGLADSTDFFRVEPISLQELTLGISDRTVTQTLTDTVQVLVSDLTGLNITSGQFDLSFTSSKLEILSISTEGTILDGRQAPTVFEGGSQMSIAFADAQPYEGEGALFNIIFRVNREATGTASFIPQNVLFNETYEADTFDGTVTIENAPEIVINQPSNELTIGEGQTYTVESGGTAPYTWQSDDETVAVINENTGELEALSRGVVNITATDSENFVSEHVQLTVNDVTISLPDTVINDNNIFSLPVQTTDLTGLGVVAYEIDLDFDGSLLNFESVESAGSISEGLNITSSEEAGVLKIAAAGTSELSGEGDLLYVNFSIPNTVELGSSGIVNPLRVQFNEPGENTPTATRRSGIINYESSGDPDPVVAADLSSLSATSPHLADGEDPSFVTVTLIDTDGNPIEGFDLANLSVQVTGNAVPTAPDGLSNPGEYGFTVTNGTAETVTVTVTADGVELTDQPQIVFEEPQQPVDAVLSSVTATTPHLADGEDQSLVTVALQDANGNPIDRFAPGDLFIEVSGSAVNTGADNTGNPGEFAFTVTNTVAETVTVSITVDDVLLTDQPEIVFEEVEIGIPTAPVLTVVSAVDGSAVINWSVPSVDFTDGFLLYRGNSVQNLTVIDELNPGIRTYSDQSPLEGTAIYAISAVNSNGEESALSNTLLFVNSEVVASTEWQLISTSLQEETSEMELATIYSFSDRYDLNTFFEPGRGYWVKTRTFDEERLPASGPGLDSLSIQLNAGWNLIGSLSLPAPLLAISDPDEILTETPVYLYRESNYQVTNELLPNFGHWIYAREDGNITIDVKNTPPVAGLEMADSGMASRESNTIETEMATIEFRQGDYSAQIFASQSYLSESEQQRYLLPPVSPDPKLDVRVNRKSRLINSERSKIQIT